MRVGSVSDVLTHHTWHTRLHAEAIDSLPALSVMGTPGKGVDRVRPGFGSCAWGGGPPVGVKVERPRRSEDERP